MYYEIQEFYAKVGGEPRWHAAFYANGVHTQGSFLVLEEGEAERIFLPADRRYRVVKVEDE